MVGTNSASVNCVDPSDWKTAWLKVIVADVLIVFTAKASDIVGDSCEKIDNVKIFELIDTLGGFDQVQLSSVITEILNYNRSKISTLGYKVDQATNKLETRNIVV